MEDQKAELLKSTLTGSSDTFQRRNDWMFHAKIIGWNNHNQCKYMESSLPVGCVARMHHHRIHPSFFIGELSLIVGIPDVVSVDLDLGKINPYDDEDILQNIRTHQSALISLPKLRQKITNRVHCIYQYPKQIIMSIFSALGLGVYAIIIFMCCTCWINKKNDQQ